METQNTEAVLKKLLNSNKKTVQEKIASKYNPVKDLYNEGKKQHPATLVVLALVALGTIMGIFTAVTTPTEAREIDHKVYEINQRILQLEDSLMTKQVEFTRLDETHTLLDEKVRDIQQEIGMVVGQKSSLTLEGQSVRREIADLNIDKMRLTERKVELLGLVSAR